MKTGKKQSGFVVGVTLSAGILMLLLAVGLAVPALRPLALQAGNVLCLGIIALGLGVAVYTVWRIATYPSRRRRRIVRLRE